MITEEQKTILRILGFNVEPLPPKLKKMFTDKKYVLVQKRLSHRTLKRLSRSTLEEEWEKLWLLYEKNELW